MIINSSTNHSNSRRHHLISLVVLQILQVFLANHHNLIIVLSRPLETSSITTTTTTTTTTTIAATTTTTPLTNPSATLNESTKRSQGNWNGNNIINYEGQLQAPLQLAQHSTGSLNANIVVGPLAPVPHAFLNNQVTRAQDRPGSPQPFGNRYVPTTAASGVNQINQHHHHHHHRQQQQQQQHHSHQQQHQQQQQQPVYNSESSRIWQPFHWLRSYPIKFTINNNNNNSNPSSSNLQHHNHSGQALESKSSLRKALLSLQNPRLLGGDILVRTGPNGGAGRRNGRLIKFERSALVSPISLWPNGIIMYELDASVEHLAELIWKVMQQFHESTCIRFIPRENNEPDYLRIEALRGCFSYIGRIGGEQTLSLGDGCGYKGTISHELLHAVGFFHHQNRSDRDDFLEILWENIAKGKEAQFSKMAPHENILLNEFDYNSIMLYGPRTFGKTLDRVTMKPKREGVILLEVIEKQGLSALDIDSVNRLYKCESLYA